VRQREGRHLQEDRLPALGEEEHPEHEQDVVDPLRQDVREAERQILPDDVDGGRWDDLAPKLERTASLTSLDPLPLGLGHPFRPERQQVGAERQRVRPREVARAPGDRAGQDERRLGAVRVRVLPLRSRLDALAVEPRLRMREHLREDPTHRRRLELRGKISDPSGRGRRRRGETGREMLAVDDHLDTVRPVLPERREGADRAELVCRGDRGERREKQGDRDGPFTIR
jgi:hypothetical protein